MCTRIDRRVRPGPSLGCGERGALGILAIASNDTERYLPTMSTDYLVRIGEIVTEAVSARLA